MESSDLTADLCSTNCVAHACSSYTAQRQFKCKLNVEARGAQNSVFQSSETLQMQNEVSEEMITGDFSEFVLPMFKSK